MARGTAEVDRYTRRDPGEKQAIGRHLEKLIGTERGAVSELAEKLHPTLGGSLAALKQGLRNAMNGNGLSQKYVDAIKDSEGVDVVTGEGKASKPIKAKTTRRGTRKPSRAAEAAGGEEKVITGVEAPQAIRDRLKELLSNPEFKLVQKSDGSLEWRAAASASVKLTPEEE